MPTRPLPDMPGSRSPRSPEGTGLSTRMHSPAPQSTRAPRLGPQGVDSTSGQATCSRPHAIDAMGAFFLEPFRRCDATLRADGGPLPGSLAPNWETFPRRWEAFPGATLVDQLTPNWCLTSGIGLTWSASSVGQLVGHWLTCGWKAFPVGSLPRGQPSQEAFPKLPQ